MPAGALSESTTVTLTIYSSSGLPRVLQSRLRKTAALPTGATFIAGMNVTLGSGSLIKPLAFAVAGVSNVPAGDALRLAGSAQGAFSDIDTATQTSGTISEAGDPSYTGVSLAGASVLYVFYSVAAANALPVPAVNVTVSGPGSVLVGSQTTYSASEVGADGFPFFLSAFTFSVDSAALGSIDATTGILTATITNNSVGHVFATDRRSTSISGTLPVTVLSSRPATAGDSLSYAGTFSSSTANNAISSSPLTSTQTASVIEKVSVGSDASNNIVISDSESDAFQLSTLTTNTKSTLAYQTAATSTNVRMLESTSSDSNNVTYQTQYTPTSGLLTVEPENAGTFGPNDASETYAETDPGINVTASGQNVSTTRTTATNGSYKETTNNADGTTNTAIQNVDGTGSYAIASASQGPVNVTIGLPTTGVSPTIPISLVATKTNVDKTISAPLWYSLPFGAYSESDTISASTSYDSRCSVPALYGTVSTKVVEAATSVDAVYGNLENQTTTSYDVAGFGTVCSIFTDTTQTFYDYTGQEPNFITFNSSATPVLSTAVTQALSITAASVNGEPVSTQSLKRSKLGLGRLSAAVSRERFRHAVRQVKIAQNARRAAALRRMQQAH